jgi:hypothetical protein
VKAIETLVAWVEARAAAGHKPPTSWQGLIEDFKHSAYLRRVLEDGRKALPEAPPKLRGQPWYALVEEGRAVVTDVTFTDEYVSIHKSRWKVVAEPDPGAEYELSYPGHTARWHLCRLPTDEASGYEAGRWALIMEKKATP